MTHRAFCVTVSTVPDAERSARTDTESALRARTRLPQAPSRAQGQRESVRESEREREKGARQRSYTAHIFTYSPFTSQHFPFSSVCQLFNGRVKSESHSELHGIDCLSGPSLRQRSQNAQRGVTTQLGGERAFRPRCSKLFWVIQTRSWWSSSTCQTTSRRRPRGQRLEFARRGLDKFAR